MLETIAYVFIGFVWGCLFHRWMEHKGYSNAFWEGFTFRWLFKGASK
jgi:hypothetical protein